MPFEKWRLLAENLDEDDRGKVISIMWNIWNYRNLIKQNPNKPDPNSIIRSVKAFWEGRSYLSAVNKEPSRFKSSLSQSWSFPPRNFWKINTDASWSEDKGIGGIGWIARDSLGSFICAGFKRMKRKWSILSLELKAIEESLLLAEIGNPLPRIIVESDYAFAIAILNREFEVFSESRLVANDVEIAAELVGSVEYSFSRREFNIAGNT